MSAKLHRLFHQQGGKCCYCDRDTWLPASGETKKHARQRLGIRDDAYGAARAFRWRHATIEHLLRVVDGGTNRLGNLKMACFGCNGRRGSMTPEAYREHVQELVRTGMDYWARYLRRCTDPGRALQQAVIYSTEEAEL